MSDRPRLLLTGFGPFPGAPRNPCGAVVARVAARLAGSDMVTVIPRVLDTTWAALDAFDDLLAATRPTIVLHLGLATRARAIHVERWARNRVAVAAVDAAGARVAGPMLDADGPPARRARVPVAGLARRMAATGVPVTPSDDAGRYLCNALLWRSLGADPIRPTGFLHLPPTRAMSGAAATRLTEADLAEAVTAAVTWLARRAR